MYFAAIGGFRIANDRVVKGWHRAIASGLFTVQELRLAISAKALGIRRESPEQARQARKRFVRGPLAFLLAAGS